jgi:hypothetical protein
MTSTAARPAVPLRRRLATTAVGATLVVTGAAGVAHASSSQDHRAGSTWAGHHDTAGTTTWAGSTWAGSGKGKSATSIRLG